jgi:hypothetical protein
MSVADDRQYQETTSVWRYEDDKTKAKIRCDVGVIGDENTWMRATWSDEGALPIELNATGIGLPSLLMGPMTAQRLCAVLTRLLAELEAK